jgi:hypothetical protein
VSYAASCWQHTASTAWSISTTGLITPRCHPSAHACAVAAAATSTRRFARHGVGGERRDGLVDPAVEDHNEVSRHCGGPQHRPPAPKSCDRPTSACGRDVGRRRAALEARHCDCGHGARSSRSYNTASAVRVRIHRCQACFNRNSISAFFVITARHGVPVAELDGDRRRRDRRRAAFSRHLPL